MGFMFQRMVVVGVGLIGGSLALDARKRGLVGDVVGYGRSEKNLRIAKKARMIDRYLLGGEKVPQGTDLVIFATPVETTLSLARVFTPSLEPGCLISDVGSVKEKIVREMEKLLPSANPFVGAHPIAGGEQWGAEAARTGLFLGQRCILTPTSKTDTKALKRVATLWRRVGAKVESMAPDLHDRVLGVVSHLPHVLAYALVNLLSRSRVDSIDLKDYCGGGFKDLTRIASSRPEIWRDICLMNRRAVAQSLGDYVQQLEHLKKWILQGSGDRLEREFAEANEIRRQIV